MSDRDEKTAIENMPFFLENLAGRFENEECPTLPKLCRAVATEIARLQDVVKAGDALYRQLYNIKEVRPRWANESVCEAMRDFEQALATLKEQK